MKSRRTINYTQLALDEDYIGKESSFDPRFDMSEGSDKVPWKSVALAVFLLSFGCVLLLLSLFVFTGHMGGDNSQAYGLLGLGTLTFLPVLFVGIVPCHCIWYVDRSAHDKTGRGFYITRIAFYSWRGAQGYRFAAIPCH